MKNCFLIYLFFASTILFGQKQKQCSCLKVWTFDKIEDCQEKILKDKSKLYYQFNCDSIWLTLERPSGKKKILYSLSGEDYKDLGPYNYRLGYYFINEFETELLFRFGCPATGSCNYVLVNKKSGTTTQKFSNLILDLNKESNNEFLIYFDETTDDNLIVQFVDLKKKIKIPINPSHFTQIIPEFQFDEIYLKDNILVMTYIYDEDEIEKQGKIEYDVSKYIR